MRCYLSLVFCALMLCVQCNALARATDVPAQQVRAAIEKAVPFLLRDGQAWFDGEIDVQIQSCVSCHQVPTGLWSLAAADRVLQRQPSAEFSQLLSDSHAFVTNPEEDNAPAAAVSQLLLASLMYPAQAEGEARPAVAELVRLAFKSQLQNGTWAAQGQFPSQRRPISESDLVVTMWMVWALESSPLAGPEISESLSRARAAVQQSDGKSTEWLAWRLLLARSGTVEATALLKQLTGRQNDDGSWGWAAHSAGEPYSTGVALFAIASTSSGLATAATRDAAKYLLQQQQDDGSWSFEGSLISRKSSYSRDYIYRYWGTAWATLGLSEYLSNYGE